MSARFPFATVDELSCYFDDPGEPNNVTLEAVIDTGLDPDRLRAAVSATFAARPRARVRRTPWRGWHTGFTWEIADWLDVDPVDRVTWTTPAELAAHRDRVFARAPALHLSPPLRLCHAVGPDRDVLLLSAHHAALDGRSSLRLLRSIARHYTGEPDLDPVPAPTTTRPVKPGNQLHGRPARIAPEGGRDGPGYGFHLLELPCWPVAGAGAATVNDVLIAALALTIVDWNRRHDAAGGQLRITMPIDTRASAAQLGNLSRLAVIGVAHAESPGVLLAGISRQTRAAKASGGPPVDAVSRLCATPVLPVAVKARVLRVARALAGPWWSDTSLLSNLGVVRGLTFGSDAPVRALWFAAPAPMPRGLSVGAVTVRDRLHLCFRYRTALFDAVAAAKFAQAFTGALARLGDPRFAFGSRSA